jgi:hypothetical protein
MAINTAGIVKGGLVAGLLINIGEILLNVPVAGARFDAELAARNVPPVAGLAIVIFVVMCFGLGLFLVWLYAAIRPRFGPGPLTATCAGLIVWGLAYLWAFVSLGVMGFYSWGLAMVVIAWGLVEIVLASIAGAYFYTE